MKTPLQMNPNTALPPKVKELIGLAVAAQIPCKSCIYAHTRFAKAEGASQAEIGEAVTLAALTRHWSTVLQGAQLDLGVFKAEIGKVVAHLAQGAPASEPAPEVSDAASARRQIEQSWGMLPSFIGKFPEASLAGGRKELRDVEMNPISAIPGKYKSLIGIAVGSQIPCRYCLAADTEPAHQPVAAR